MVKFENHQEPVARKLLAEIDDHEFMPPPAAFLSEVSRSFVFNAVNVMRILLIQLDGKTPNLALMRIAAHHRALGNRSLFVSGPEHQHRPLRETRFNFASLIFTASRPRAINLLQTYPGAIIAALVGTLCSSWKILASKRKTSTIRSIRGSAKPRFTQRGCRLNAHSVWCLRKKVR
jgi:hypothetical protein